MSTENVDVAIVGGGVGGAALALALGQAGKRTVVLERRTSPGLNGADVLKPVGIQVLRRLGLLDELIRRGARRRYDLEVYHDAKRLAVLDYRQESKEGSFMLVPYATTLLSLLSHLETQQNVEYRTGAEITGLQGESRIDRIWMKDGSTIVPKFVIGADGRESFVRKSLGIQVKAHSYEQRMWLAKFPMVASVEERNRLYVDSKGGLAYFYPVGHSDFRAVLGFPHDEGQSLMSSGDVSRLVSRLQEFVPASDDAIGRIVSLEGFAEIPLRRMHAPQYGKGNVLLLGDAIHNAHPITGQGMNAALEDVGVLSDALIAALDGSLSEAECLISYQRQRYPLNEAVVTYGNNLAMGLSDQAAFARALNLNIQSSGRDAKAIASVVAGQQL